MKKLILIFGCLTILACKEKSRQKEERITKRISITEFFKQNNWNYPNNINVDFIKENFDKNVISTQVKKWINSNYGKYDEATNIIVVDAISKSEKSSVITFRVTFYRPGEIENNMIIPIEGHGIVANSFYESTEYPKFFFMNDTLKFWKWY